MIPFKLVSALKLNVLTLSNMPVERWSTAAVPAAFPHAGEQVCCLSVVAALLLLCTAGLFLLRPTLSRGCFSASSVPCFCFFYVALSVV
jgi:hypothetical protein